VGEQIFDNGVVAPVRGSGNWGDPTAPGEIHIGATLDKPLRDRGMVALNGNK